MAETAKPAERKTSAPKSPKVSQAKTGESKTRAATTPRTAAAGSKVAGIYINRRPETAFFTVLLPGGTCAMFLMLSAQTVFFMGQTKYKLTGDKLQFKIQNPDGPVIPPQTPERKSRKTPATPKTTAGEQFIEATLKPGIGYTQHGKKENTVFDFLTADTKYWEKLGLKKLGKGRLLDDKVDFDIAHEIKKLCILSITIYGNEFIWA